MKDKYYFINDYSPGSVIATKEDIERYIINGVGDLPNNKMWLVKDDGEYNFETDVKKFVKEENQLYGKLFSVIL